jgi:hypothetical protein
VLVYRVQPPGKDLGKHRSETSSGEKDSGVHVFESPGHLESGVSGWLIPKQKQEIVVIRANTADLAENGDYEGTVLRQNKGNIVARMPISPSELRQKARDSTLAAYVAAWVGGKRWTGQGFSNPTTEATLRAAFDPSQPRDEQGRWTDTGDGGMEWTTSKGTKVKVEAGGTVEIKGTRFPMKEPGPSALGKDQADKFRRSGMNPDDYRDIGGGMVAHKDDDDRWAEAGRRRKAFVEKVKATKPTPQEDWNNLVLERRHAAEHGSGYMDIYKVERKMDEFKKAHPEYANR